MNIIYSKSSVKVINSMDKATKQRIKAGIEKIPEGDIKPLQGIPGTYRLRVGAGAYCFLIRNVIQS